MRIGFSWGNNVEYELLKDEKSICKYSKTNCYRELKNTNSDFYNKIRIYNIDCDKTIDYKIFYLNYISDMLKLEVNITDDYFEFKSFSCENKNLLVCSLTRLLWEYLGNIRNEELGFNLIKELKNGKSKYKNKLKRFCDFYSKLTNSYFYTGHSWTPNETLIKSTDDFIKTKSLISVNSFFIE